MTEIFKSNEKISRFFHLSYQISLNELKFFNPDRALRSRGLYLMPEMFFALKQQGKISYYFRTTDHLFRLS